MDSIRDLATAYKTHVGYDPFEDEPTQDHVETVDTLLGVMARAGASADEVAKVHAIRDAIYRRAETLPLWRREFPDYDPSTLPDIPSHWIDDSWHNDACPAFSTNGLVVYVDYADPEARDFPELKRFTVQVHPDRADYNETLLETDDWSEAVSFVASYQNA